MILFEIRRKVRFTLRNLSLLDAPAQAIVNAANSSLNHGGGVAGLISRAGGPEIQEESSRKAPVPTGTATHTGAGRLPFRWIVHTVGPVWQGGGKNERELLFKAVTSALEECEALGVRTVAMPAVSTGIFAFPLEPALEEINRALIAFDPRARCLEEIMLCEIDTRKADRMREILSVLMPPNPQSAGRGNVLK
ncbi:MAG: macro domain-containing protein [Acidobacteriota bacterium]|jgi:O-acetyl-ADP-ribose deacetylase (regulator of RNase III)|nr:macro domain-containing protein [Acidobacteriota bacterium]